MKPFLFVTEHEARARAALAFLTREAPELLPEIHRGEYGSWFVDGGEALTWTAAAHWNERVKAHLIDLYDRGQLR